MPKQPNNKSDDTKPESSDPLYKIGAVSRLTGLPSNTIRTWERRYKVVEPQRTSGGGRLYTDTDVSRLQIIATLMGLDESISAVCHLSLTDLRARLQMHQHTPSEALSTGDDSLTKASVAIASANYSNLKSLLTEEGSTLFDCVYAHQDLSGINGTKIDILITNLENLGEVPEKGLEALVAKWRIPSVVVIYGFCRRNTLDALTDLGARMLRIPVSGFGLTRMLEDQVRTMRLQTAVRSFSSASVGELSPFSQDTEFTKKLLNKIVSSKPNTGCECPNHLASISLMLRAFEDYSTTCQNESSDDAELHAKLAKETEKARHIVESMLSYLVQYDGLKF